MLSRVDSLQKYLYASPTKSYHLFHKFNYTILKVRPDGQTHGDIIATWEGIQKIPCCYDIMTFPNIVLELTRLVITKAFSGSNRIVVIARANRFQLTKRSPSLPP